MDGTITILQSNYVTTSRIQLCFRFKTAQPSNQVETIHSHAAIYFQQRYCD